MTFPSPSQRAAIEIRQTRFANESAARVDFVKADRRAEIYERRREAFIYFVHVYWSPDETRVAVLATGSMSFGVAFDTKMGREIPFPEVENDLGRSIATTYHLPSGADPIDWASSTDAAGAFGKLHPEIRLSYR